MKAAISWLDKNIEIAIISFFIAIIATLMTLQVIMRYVFLNALPWVEEIVVYLNVWNAFLGCSYAMRHRCEMQVDFVKSLPKIPRRIIERIAEVILLLFYIYIVKAGWGVTMNFIATGQKSAAAQIPVYLVYSSFLIGSAGSILRYIQRLVSEFITWNKARKEGKEA